MNYITSKEICKKLGASRSTIYKLRQQGMPVIKIGGFIRYPEEEVDKWLLSRSKKS